jgi:release factor glutamine methyltransferase
MTAREALARATARLAEAGIPDPAWDAERLVRHVLGWDRAALLTRDGEPLDAEAEARLLNLVEQRAQRRPLQHLTGTQPFWRHEFLVTPDVLVPRPETELLVEEALRLLHDVHAPRVVDVGTGSGCIALSLAAERGDAEVHAVDISPAALAVAAENARRLGLEGRVRFHQGDLLAPLERSGRRLDLVACNPPYVDAAEWPSLPPEVREHEPAVALLPPGDRFSVYRRLVPQAAGLLCASGYLLLELGRGAEHQVAGICEAGGLRVVRVLPDLQSIPRCLVARGADEGGSASGRDRTRPPAC